MNRSCKECRHAVELTKPANVTDLDWSKRPNVVECRRFPPQLVVLPAASRAVVDPVTKRMVQQAVMLPSPQYPQVRADQPCGEFAPTLVS